MTRFPAAALAALLAFSTPTAAPAQQFSPAGGWYCEVGVRDTAPGVPPNPVMMQIQMAVYPNGYAEGQGMDAGSSGQWPFQFQGRWWMEGRTFWLQMQKSSSMGMGPAEFTIKSNVTSANTLALTEQWATGKIYAAQCQRTG